MRQRDRVRWALAWLATLVALCALTALAGAQTAPPVSNIEMSPQVVHFLDSLALDARTNRVENGACLGAYSVKDSTLTLERLDPAHYLKADSVTIWGDTATHYAGICPPGIPTLHTHVSNGGLTPPSDIDRNTARLRGVWNLLLQARRNGYLLFVY